MPGRRRATGRWISPRRRGSGIGSHRTTSGPFRRHRHESPYRAAACEQLCVLPVGDSACTSSRSPPQGCKPLAESADVDAFDKPCGSPRPACGFSLWRTWSRLAVDPRSTCAGNALAQDLCRPDPAPLSQMQSRAEPRSRSCPAAVTDELPHGGSRATGSVRTAPGPARSPWGDSAAPPRHPRPHPRQAGRAMCYADRYGRVGGCDHRSGTRRSSQEPRLREPPTASSASAQPISRRSRTGAIRCGCAVSGLRVESRQEGPRRGLAVSLTPR